jgi:hypothetical protein
VCVLCIELAWPTGNLTTPLLACRLLDLGFEKDVSTLINSLQELSLQHQTILLSATLSAGECDIWLERSHCYRLYWLDWMYAFDTTWKQYNSFIAYCMNKIMYCCHFIADRIHLAYSEKPVWPIRLLAYPAQRVFICIFCKYRYFVLKLKLANGKR